MQNWMGEAEMLNAVTVLVCGGFMPMPNKQKKVQDPADLALMRQALRVKVGKLRPAEVLAVYALVSALTYGRGGNGGELGDSGTTCQGD